MHLRYTHNACTPSLRVLIDKLPSVSSARPEHATSPLGPPKSKFRLSGCGFCSDFFSWFCSLSLFAAGGNRSAFKPRWWHFRSRAQPRISYCMLRVCFISGNLCIQFYLKIKHKFISQSYIIQSIRQQWYVVSTFIYINYQKHSCVPFLWNFGRNLCILLIY